MYALSSFANKYTHARMHTHNSQHVHQLGHGVPLLHDDLLGPVHQSGVGVFHPHGHHGRQDVQGLPHYGTGIHRMGLQKAGRTGREEVKNGIIIRTVQSFSSSFRFFKCAQQVFYMILSIPFKTDSLLFNS